MKAEGQKDKGNERSPSAYDLVDWNEISRRGLIERINREIMHPLGLAICRDPKTGVSNGALVSPDGSWVYAEESNKGDTRD